MIRQLSSSIKKVCSVYCVRVVSDLVLLLPDDECRGPVTTGHPAGQLQPGVSLHHQTSLATIYLCY